MKSFLVVCVVFLIGVGIFVVQIPPYQGRYSLQEATFNEAENKLGEWKTYVEVSPQELDAIGLPIEHNDVVVDSVINSKTPYDNMFYLRKDKYLQYQTKLETMRPTKWFRWP